MDMYRQHILEEYKHPQNFGHLSRPDVSQTLSNTTCGDKITIEMKFSNDQKIVQDIRFCGEGCAISQASASLVTAYAKGKKITRIMKWNSKTVCTLLGINLSVSRIGCALLPLETVQKCILEWEKGRMV